MLTVDGKKEVCGYFFGLEGDDKETIMDFSKNHKLKRSSFGVALLKYRCLQDKGIDTFYDQRGRPRFLDSQGYSSLLSQLVKKKKEQITVSTYKFRDFITEEIGASASRRGVADAKFRVCRNTIGSIMTELNASAVEAQKKTHARIFAESDPRNNYTIAVMLYTFCMALVANMFFNWDATQYTISLDNTGKFIIVKIEGDTQPVTTESAGTIPVSVKQFHLHNAAGEVSLCARIFGC
jgi:hypothetical protein